MGVCVCVCVCVCVWWGGAAIPYTPWIRHRMVQPTCGVDQYWQNQVLGPLKLTSCDDTKCHQGCYNDQRFSDVKSSIVSFNTYIQ